MGNMLVNTRDQKFVLYEQIGIEKLFDSRRKPSVPCFCNHLISGYRCLPRTPIRGSPV